MCARVVIEPGKKYNHLTALYYNGVSDKGFQTWVCECDCADKTRVVVKAADLSGNHRKSCGCMKGKGYNTRHNMSKTRIYNIYHKMISRCHNPNEKEYKNYGARGITVCEQWRNDFNSFVEWSMDNGYKSDLSIDRVDNEKGYSPDNCRWATFKQQENNRRNNHFLTFRNERHTLSEWGDITGIGQDNIYARLKLGWSVERTLTEKVKRRKEYAV